MSATNNQSVAICPPPRDVPLSLRLHMILGGAFAQCGWLFLAIGLAVAWFIVEAADFASLWQFYGKLESTRGTVLRSEETNYTENEQRVYEVHYQFVHDKHPYLGTSYSRVRPPAVGAAVTVEFPVGRPERSRIKGMRSNMAAPWIAIFFLHPLAGLLIVVYSVRSGRRALRLLQFGEVAFADKTAQEATNVTHNKRRAHKFTYAFTAADGTTHEASFTSCHPERLTDHGQMLLYDPSSPIHALPLEEMPGQPRLDEAGYVKPRSGVTALLSLVLPAATVIGHGAYAIKRLVG
jgi:hypothetical protein